MDTSILYELAYQSGYIGLFIISFLAATLLPLGSEPLVILMIVTSYNPVTVFVVATAGNFFGASTNYWLGQKGRTALCLSSRKMNDVRLERAQKIYMKWGAPTLLLSWVPVIGDPLTLVAGFMGMHFRAFCVWVLVGKAARYALVIWTTLLARNL